MTTTPETTPEATPDSSTHKKTPVYDRPLVAKTNRTQLSNKEFFAMAILGFIVAVVWFFVLFGIGTGATRNSFLARAVLPIVLLNVILFAWPFIKAFRRKEVIRCVIIFALVGLLLLLIPVIMWIFGAIGFAQALWQFRIFGIVALILNVWLAILLTTYEKVDPKVTQLTKEKADAERDVETAESQVRIAGTAVEVAKEQLEPAQKRHDEAAADLKAKSEYFSEMEKKIGKNSSLADEREAAADLKEAVDQHATTVANVKALQKQLETPADDATRTKITKNLAEVMADIPSLEEAVHAATLVHQRAERVVKADPEVAEHKKAQKESAAAQIAEASARKELSEVKKTLRRAERDYAVAGDTLQVQEHKVAAADAQLPDAEAASKKDLRWFWWGVGLLYVGMLVFYPSWYGWVIVSVATK